MNKKIIGYTEFLWNNTLIEIRNRYAGSGLGLFWAVLHPLAQILLFVAVFSRIMSFHLQGPGNQTVSFSLYLCSAFLPWIGFSDIISRSTNCLSTNAGHIMSLGLPEHVVFLKEACSGMVGIFIGGGIFLLVSLFSGAGWFPSWPLIIPVFILFTGLAYGLGMMIGVMNVFWKDIGQSVGVLLQMLMWATPIVYAESILPDAYQAFLPFIPTYPFITAIHDTLVFGLAPGITTWLMMTVYTITFMLGGHALLGMFRSDIRDSL